MIRAVLALAFSAAFGAVAIGPVRERVQDHLLQPVEAIAVGLVALAAALAGATILVLGRTTRVPKLDPCIRLTIDDARVRLALDDAMRKRTESGLIPT